MLEKTLESPLDCKGIKPVNPKENQSWIFIGQTDAEAPILWPPDAKDCLIKKDSDPGKDWRQEEKGCVQSLHREDPMEKGMAAHSSILAWRILWTEEPGGLQSMASLRVRQGWATNTHTPGIRISNKILAFKWFSHLKIYLLRIYWSLWRGYCKPMLQNKPLL